MYRFFYLYDGQVKIYTASSVEVAIGTDRKLTKNKIPYIAYKTSDHGKYDAKKDTKPFASYKEERLKQAVEKIATSIV